MRYKFFHHIVLQISIIVYLVILKIKGPFISNALAGAIITGAVFIEYIAGFSIAGGISAKVIRSRDAE